MKNSRLRKAAKSVAEVLDLPYEALGDQPAIRIMGSSRAMVENHLGIVEYSQTTVRVRTVLGILRIWGKGLTIDGIGSQRLVVSGEIGGVDLGGRGHE